jgi:hypothetical protein
LIRYLQDECLKKFPKNIRDLSVSIIKMTGSAILLFETGMLKWQKAGRQAQPLFLNIKCDKNLISYSVAR